MLSSRVVWVDHGGRGRGGNPLAKVGLLMISVVVVAVVVVASVVVAVVVVSTVLLSALVSVAPVVVVALFLSMVTSLPVATVAAAVVLLLLTAVRIVVSRRFVDSAPVAALAAGSVSRRLLVLLETIAFFVTFVFAKGIEFCHRRGAALRCARGPTFLVYAIGVHVAHDDHSFFKIEIFLGFGLVLDSIIERWKPTRNDGS